MNTGGALAAAVLVALAAAPGLAQPAKRGDAGAPKSDFPLGAMTGTSRPDSTLPGGTVEVHLLDPAGRPMDGVEVSLGAATRTGGLEVQKAKADASGVARFHQLATGEDATYAAVVEHDGARLGTNAFHLDAPPGPGVRAEIRMVARTSDPSVIRVGDGSHLIVALREQAIEVVEILRIENRSDRVFDPGPGGLDVPLPDGFVEAQATEGSVDLVPTKQGIALRAPVPPGGVEIRFAFLLPYDGRSHELRQTLPNGLGAFSLIVEQVAGLTVAGKGLSPQGEREAKGHRMLVSAGAAIPPGGVLTLHFEGLPGPDLTGRIVAGTLAAAMILAALLFARPAGAARTDLARRREELFAELVAFEQARRRTPAAADGVRNELVAKIEAADRELDTLEGARP